ncbi:MAG: DNA polymerase I [Bdellovibrionales bacterium]|nr:DNA polymerase I [Bdellovibrionales bacterium]
MSEKIYLIDGSAYIFRAYYAVAPLTNSKGFPTNALYGFTRMLVKLLAECDSNHLVMIFDSGKKTFRNDLYSEYKANRSECPEDLVPQMPVFREISSALGMSVLELENYEADDVIGTLTHRLDKEGHEVVIVSADKDLMQLVNDRVSMWDTMRDRKYGVKEVVEKFGVPPEKVVEILGLTGDSSDNIPGLKGVGPKTATQLIEKFGTVENLIKNISEIESDKNIRGRKKIVENLANDSDILKLSRKLVEIDCDAPVILTLNDSQKSLGELTSSELVEILSLKGAKQDELTELFERLDFQSLLRDLKLPVKSSNELKENSQYKLVKKADFPDFLNGIKAANSFAFDVETTSLKAHEAELIGVAFCWDDSLAYYLPLTHAKESADFVTLHEFCSEMREVFSETSIKKIGQNLKFDISILEQQGLSVNGLGFDTMLASYLLRPDRGSHNLTALAKEFLNAKMVEFSDIVPEGETFASVPLEAALDYAAEDAHYTWLISKKLEERLSAEDLVEVLAKVDLPLVPVLSRMELAGISIDVDLLASLSEEFAQRLLELEQKIYAEAGCEFNINSPKQLSEVLYDKLNIPTKGLKRTKTGVSTNQAVLEKLSYDYEIPKLILDYRSIHKLKSTYVDALPSQISPVTGRLHTKLNQAITGTGRLSSSDPNLQNIPISSSEGRRIREAFVPSKGNLLLSADYSQIELRVLAHMSKDENLSLAFKNNIDVHAKTARDIFAIPPLVEVSAVERRAGKTINFGIVYGISAFRLGRELGIPLSVANDYISEYFANYSSVKKYFAELEAQSESQGFVTTLFGRKRFLKDIDASGRDKNFLKRVAINAPIQGTAADIIKLAMISLDAKIRSDKLPIKLVLQIHDELLFEVEESFSSQAIEIIKSEMENVIKLNVPLVVDVGVGSNWKEAH